MKPFHLNIPGVAVMLGILFSSFFISGSMNAQSKYHPAGNVQITIEGTSNIHDWTMKSDQGTCTGEIEINNSGALAGLSALSFSVPAESLKSEHKAMDKNTYKALNTNKYGTISFTVEAVGLKPAGNSGYILTAKGKLTISGVTKDILLTANGVINPDKSITYNGSYKLKMTDYNVEPPSIMFGAIKTGDNVVVKFNLILKES
jgi:polyisoprenoid-binding protein YceI